MSKIKSRQKANDSNKNSNNSKYKSQVLFQKLLTIKIVLALIKY